MLQNVFFFIHMKCVVSVNTLKWQRVYFIRQVYPHIGKNHSPTVVFVSLFFQPHSQIFIAPGLQDALIMFSNGLRLNRAVAGYLEWEKKHSVSVDCRKGL